MKKLFSIFAAVLFAGSMFATDATMTAGTNGSSVTVNGNAAIKCGTSKAGGDMTITVGANATKLTFYAAAWKGVSGSSITIAAPEGVTISSSSCSLTPDDGISNNSPFTLNGTEEDFKFEITLSDVSSETELTLSGDKRFVVWAATYTTGEGGEGGEEGGDDPVVESAYYLAGSMNSWAPAEAYKFAANPSQDGEFVLNTTLEVGDEFKVARSDNGTSFADDAWYPQGMNNNFVVTEDYAGEKTIYFRPAGNEAWDQLEGYIYVEANGSGETGDDQEEDEAVAATMTTGTNASAAAVNEKDAIKCGTSKAGGDMTITVGANATKLTFYAAAWKGVSGSSISIAAPEGVTVSPSSCSLTPDDGISNNPPFTLAGAEEDFKFEITLSDVSSEATLTVAGDKRFVVWAATYTTGESSGEGGEGGDDPVQETIKDPVIAGNASFQEEVSVTITCETEDAEIHYTLDGSNPDADSPLYEEALTLTATTTVRAIALKDELVSEIVEKTFTAFPTEMTCADAAEAALSVSGNNVNYADGLEFSVTGYVTAIQTAWSNYKNVSFWIADSKDGGQVIEAFRAACENEEDAPGVGDLVTVSGKLTKYGTTPEFAAGCTFVIEEKDVPAVNLGAKSIAEFLEMKNSKDTCILTGVVANIVLSGEEYNVYGNFDLVDENDADIKVYIYGLLTADGQSKKFREMGIDAGDLLTLKAIYSEHNGEPQVANAIFVSVVKNETTGISNTAVDVKAQKLIRDGQLYIMRNGVLYNANGAVVK